MAKISANGCHKVAEITVVRRADPHQAIYRWVLRSDGKVLTRPAASEIGYTVSKFSTPRHGSQNEGQLALMSLAHNNGYRLARDA